MIYGLRCKHYHILRKINKIN